MLQRNNLTLLFKLKGTPGALLIDYSKFYAFFSSFLLLLFFFLFLFIKKNDHKKAPQCHTPLLLWYQIYCTKRKRKK